MKQLNLDGFHVHELKENPLKQKDVEELKDMAGSYEALFSRRARLYKEKGLKNMKLAEDDYISFLLEHYTFLKRPIFIIDKEIFIGNSKKTIEALKQKLSEK